MIKKLVKNVFFAVCVISLLSGCTITIPRNINLNSSTDPDTEPFVCDDLEKINDILFVKLGYDETYDLDSDNQITVQDKLIIENDLLENNASCVTHLSVCDELPTVLAEVETWSDDPTFETAKLAIAYSIIFNESGQRCANDFGTGTFIGDVNNNGYLDCDDYQEIFIYVGSGGSLPPIIAFYPILADLDSNGHISAVDYALIKVHINILFLNYAEYLVSCPE